MKKYAFLLILLVGYSAWAQEKPLISSAIIAIDRNNNLSEAKKYIDQAQEIISSKPLTEIKAKDLSKFYFYKGKINYRIYQSEDPAISELDAQALDKALEGFLDLIEFEAQSGSERYSKDSKEQLQYVANDFARRGIGKSEGQDFMGAYEDFLKTYEIKKEAGMLDTAMLYNASVMAQNGKMYDKALDLNQQLLKMGYKGVTFSATDAATGEETVFPSGSMMNKMVNSGKYTDPKVEGDVRPDLYVAVAALALETGDTALYEETVLKGRQIFPNNPALLRSELSIFLQKEEYDKALVNLEEAVKNAEGEDKVIMYYNKGVILQNEMNRIGEALQAYEKALALDSNYSDALYMTSIIYIDSANAIGKRMNNLPLSANKQYEKLKKDQQTVFEEALPYLERAYATNPEDKQVITALRQVYRALRMYDKAKALPAEE